MGERALTSVQYGVESAHGTEVNATKILQGAEAVVPRDRIPSFPQESLGVRARSMRSEFIKFTLRRSRLGLSMDNSKPCR